MKNSIFVIKPYRWKCLWVFDDPAVGQPSSGKKRAIRPHLREKEAKYYSTNP
jgi:hypothetical protein